MESKELTKRSCLVYLLTFLFVLLASCLIGFILTVYETIISILKEIFSLAENSKSTVFDVACILTIKGDKY